MIVKFMKIPDHGNLEHMGHLEIVTLIYFYSGKMVTISTIEYAAEMVLYSTHEEISNELYQ